MFAAARMRKRPNCLAALISNYYRIFVFGGFERKWRYQASKRETSGIGEQFYISSADRTRVAPLEISEETTTNATLPEVNNLATSSLMNSSRLKTAKPHRKPCAPLQIIFGFLLRNRFAFSSTPYAFRFDWIIAVDPRSSATAICAAFNESKQKILRPSLGPNGN